MSGYIPTILTLLTLTWLGEPKRVTVTTQGPNGETVATVDEVAALKYSTTSQKE